MEASDRRVVCSRVIRSRVSGLQVLHRMETSSRMTRGSQAVVWARDTGELFFIGGKAGGARSLMASAIRLDPEVVIGTPVKLFEIPEDLSGEVDVGPDSKRFLMVRQRKEPGSQGARWVLVQNWLADVATAR